MSTDLNAAVTRRHALALGAGIAGGALASASPLTGRAAADVHSHWPNHGRLPAEAIQAIVEAEGTVTDGVLSIDIAREDIGDVKGPLGVTFTPAFEVDGTLTFQPLGRHRAFFNGDLALKAEETNRFIDAILANGLVFQAFHQHYDQMDPQIWFVHWRGVGDPLRLARAVHNVLKATSTPLPQTMPSDPTTPLNADRLGKILHGDADVGDEGVVSVAVDRIDRIVIDGIRVAPQANISTMVEFRPLNAAGTSATAAPDFSMTSREVQPVIATMRRRSWHVGCLYNQETDEHPQLYFAHMVKNGNPYALAQEIRAALDHTAVR
jgi:hypothetical protein